MANETGRLLKKNAKLLDNIEVESYDWLSFNERSHIYPDNSRKSVLMTGYHDPKDLDAKVKVPKGFYDQLVPRTQTLVPVDLQKDYILSQREMLIKKRRRMLDEEEAIAEELAELVLEEEEKAKANQWSEAAANSETQAAAATASATPAPQTATPEAQQTPHVSAAVASGENTGHAAGASASSAPHQSVYAHTTAAELEILKEQARSRGFEEGRQEGFDTGFRDGHVQGAEDGLDEGRKSGFNQGFLDGETKGLLAAESKTQTFFQKIGESIVEIEKLRSEVLAAGQEIFIEIAKIASEKLLRTQIAADSETLKNIYFHAIETYRDREFVTFEMNPHDAKKLREQIQIHQTTSPDDPMPKVRIRENAEFASGDFKMEVDSELAVQDLKRSIDTLIDEMSTQIFTNHKKVEKVG